MSGNSWQTSKPLQPERWDTNCPGAVPPPRSDCPKLPLPSVPLGQPARAPWTVPEWLGFHEERRAIRQFDGGQPEALAARGAWLDCIGRWLETHELCPVAEYVWEPELLPLARLAEAVAALERLGIAEPT
jgi:hypothetical protein